LNVEGSVTRRACVLVLVVCMGACATIDTRRVSRTTLVGEDVVTVPVSGRHPSITSTLSGAVAFVRGERVLTCERRRIRTYELRTLEIREARGNGILIHALAGAAGLAAGGVLLALAPGASDEKRVDAQTGDETFSSRDTMYAAGGLALGLGSLFTGFAVGNAARARDRELPPVRSKRSELLGTENCQAEPLAFAPVEWSAGSASGVAGALDAQGATRVDLKTVLPQTIFHGDTPAMHASFRVAGTESSPVDLAEVAAAHATDTWTAIGAQPDEITLRRFVERYPWSVQAEDARTRLDALSAERERRAWGEIEHTEALDVLDGYLQEFPRGAHAPEIRTRLVATLVESGEIDKAVAWVRVQARRSDIPEEERRRLAGLPEKALQAVAQAMWSDASARKDADSLSTFLERYPNHPRARAACVLLVEVLTDKRSLSDASSRLEACNAQQSLDPGEVERLQAGIAAGQVAVRKQAAAASADVSATAASCSGKPVATRKELARKAYAKIKRLSGRVPKAEIDQLQYKVAARCGFSPQAAGAK
jgi:hypothetical protein